MSFPLTNVQRAYLMGRSELFDAGGVSTHAYYEFKNDIDISLYEMALNKVIKRHDMLRAVINKDGTQHILDTVPEYKIRTEDLRNADKDEQDRFIMNKRSEMSHRVFQICQWPMFDIQAAKLNDNKTYLFFSCDLLIADGSSLKLFLLEILEYYQNINMEKQTVEAGFQDYILYQQKNKEGKHYIKDKEYWLGQLDTFPSAPMLPSLKRNDISEKPRFSRLQKFLPEEKWKKLRERSEKRGITFALIFYTAYLSVLAEWTSQESFAVNITLSNRGKMQGKFMNVIGDFTSLMLMPVETDNWSEDFWERVSQVQKKFMECYKHSMYDGVEFEQELMRKRGMQNQVSYPIVFTGMLSGMSASSIPPLMGEIQYSVSQTPQVYLDFQMILIKNKISLTWDYLTQQYSAEQMEKMFEQFSALIDGILDREELNVYEYIGSVTEEAQSGYNKTQMVRNVYDLQQLIRNAFAEHGSKTALKDSNDEITFEQWDKLSDSVAAYLSGIGVTAGAYVGISGERSISTLVRIIGVIKCGAAYVPIAPDCPDDRREHILSDCGCKAYLSGGLQIEEKAFVPDENNSVTSGSTAYILYTSGSTGEPKGVVISHGAVSNTIEDINRRFEITSDDVVLGVSSYCFDLSVYDIFGSLMAGAKHVIAPDARDISGIKRLLSDEDITVWNSVPAIFDLVVDSCGFRTNNTALRRVMLSGDWIPYTLPQKMKRFFRNARMISLGGATEASIWSIYYPVEDLGTDRSSIPYGYPLANQRCYVLDRHMRCAPYDVSGEIYIGGDGLADGYFGDSERTEAAFIQHPVYGRLYRTGDMGAFRRDGYIDILGRIDTQVKINGFRIELGEIESVLEKNELIDRAVVTADDINGAKELVMYIKPRCRKEYFGTDEERCGIYDLAEKLSRTNAEKIDIDSVNRFAAVLDDYCLKVMQYYVDFLSSADKPFSMTAEEWVSSNRICSKYTKLMKVWLDKLTSAGILMRENSVYSFPVSTVPTKEALLSELDDIENKYYSMGFLKDCICNMDKILRGEENILTYLFPNGGMQNADGIYKKNMIAAYCNSIVSGIIAEYEKEHNSEDVLQVLEIGAGSGGTTVPVLEKMLGENVNYHFTDISDFFMREAKQRLEKYPFVTYGIYNIDRPLHEQGMEQEKYDIILAANVMHDAVDLEKSIKGISDMLRPGGMFVLLETTKDTMPQLISTRMIDGYSNYSDFRLEKNSPLLSDREWCELLYSHGFQSARAFPEDALADLGEHIIVAFRNNERVYLRKNELQMLRHDMMKKLPHYMIPHKIMQLSEMPLSSNGKIDKRRLPSVNEVSGQNIEKVMPKNEMQSRLFDIWAESLGHSNFGITDSFFEVGGDSIMMLKTIANINESFSVQITFQDMMSSNNIAGLSNVISAKQKEYSNGKKEEG